MQKSVTIIHTYTPFQLRAWFYASVTTLPLELAETWDQRAQG